MYTSRSYLESSDYPNCEQQHVFKDDINWSNLLAEVNEKELHVVLYGFLTLRNDLSFQSPECDPLSVVEMTDNKKYLKAASLFLALSELFVKVFFDVILPDLKKFAEKHLINNMEPDNKYHDQNKQHRWIEQYHI